MPFQIIISIPRYRIPCPLSSVSPTPHLHTSLPPLLSFATTHRRRLATRQWKSLVLAALHLHGPVASCFPHPPCPSLPRDAEETATDLLLPQGVSTAAAPVAPQKAKVVRLVGCDGWVWAYAPPVMARELMQEHPCHLVCRADALLIGEKIPGVAAGEELQPGEAHLFRSVLSFVSLASSPMLSSTASATSGAGVGAEKKPGADRPFELHCTESGTLQIKFFDDFLLADAGKGMDNKDDAFAQKEEEEEKQQEQRAGLGGDARLAKNYEELVDYSKSRRWAPKLETIKEAVPPTAARSPNSAGPSV